MEEALNRLRTWVPELPPVGAVIERDGPVVRTHYGTHGEVSHGPLPESDLDALVARQVEAFARRNEPVLWPVYGYDTGLSERLRDAGFTAEPARAVLVRPIGTEPVDWPDRVEEVWLHARSAATGPHRRPYAEFAADGSHLDRSAEVASDAAGNVAWGRAVDEFMVLDGVTGPGFAAALAARDWRNPQRPALWRHPDVRYLLVEATGDLRAAFEAAGMRAVTTVTRFHRPSPGEPARTRPVRQLSAEPEHDEIWARFRERFAFRPDTRVFPGITEPPGSATWRVGDLDDARLDALSEIVHKGLRAIGEELYWLDWQHVGYRFDPARVGGAGPRWPGAVFPDGDYFGYLTSDLRLGTFGHPWEETVCVWGELRTRIDVELTAAIGAPLRRSEP
ncbi:DUF2716 domain-containing protein [Amycolatopsis sp. OK19-0408]|uniref:DUF2716 domain-containing protein n=1 Tax=Amycolatopsis iheyensis TaxID=2945988 RepID=A0A9X2N645_9PSEU|nr:DUF2716 domain-containing protein [Amycolatopsis iheyensis]MCR6481547.1 DUF2716 domain-containing protein [Amycolatopsis iheyensis]